MTGAWAQERCHFPDVWPRLDRGHDPGEIGVIDYGGGGLGHEKLSGRIAKYVPPIMGPGSTDNHAAAVAAVIAARRDAGDDGGADRGMDGCCSARLRVYDVCAAGAGTEKRFDPQAFHEALREARRDRLPILNMSFSSPELDPAATDEIRQCVESGVVLVAAMGDFGPRGPKRYPAACPGVIAVGATDRTGKRWRTSSTGSHIWISAPGESIRTVSGDESYARMSGTSFATAMVTAAVWLALRREPGASPARIRELLKSSVAARPGVPPAHTPSLGFGRLDMLRLEAALETP